MLSKCLRLTHLNAFLTKSLRTSNIIKPSIVSRFYTTENQPASQKPDPPKVEPVKSTKTEPGKGKGPVTWKSLSIAAVFGAGLLV